jgi:hypothetical protein
MDSEPWKPPAMAFIVRYLIGGASVGSPDKASSILEARQLATEGGKIYGADSAIILKVDRDGKEEIVELKRL